MAWLDSTVLLSVALLVFVRVQGRDLSSRWTGRLLALLLLSPGLRYLSALFTFPIRLQLSAWAGGLLRLAGLDVQTMGNVIVRNYPSGVPVEMAVDPACMGLQMTGVSLLVALLGLIWQENQKRVAVPVGWVGLYGLSAFGLTMGCNLFRIVLLVLFGAMPGTVAHEGIGLVCVAVYAWLPICLLAGLLVRRTGQPERETAETNRQSKKGSVGWGVGLLAAGLVVLMAATRPVRPATNLCAAEWASRVLGQPVGGDCRCKTLANGFVQLTKPGVLIYLKPQSDWFSADHSPTACWRGSGYELRRVRETVLDGHQAYVGELRKKGGTLHTAWWFSNGTTTTLSQLTMRERMLRGETGFVLVNVTGERLTDLGNAIRNRHVNR